MTSSFSVPGGGDVKIESQKLNFKEKAQAKVGSLDNVGHLPAGGAVKVANGTKLGGRLCSQGGIPAGWYLSPPFSLLKSAFLTPTPLAVVSSFLNSPE